MKTFFLFAALALAAIAPGYAQTSSGTTTVTVGNCTYIFVTVPVPWAPPAPISLSGSCGPFNVIVVYVPVPARSEHATRPPLPPRASDRDH